jgi:quercetin dioxygenase-like cupin family protein
MNAATDPLVLALEELVNGGGQSAYVAQVLDRVARELAATAAPMAWETVPLSAFDRPLPDAIRSCWVFLIRAGAETGAERHPNSHQRSLSLTGRGEFQLREGGRWESHPLVSGEDAPLERRWVSIPPSTWHRLFVGDENWGMLSLHTVAAEDLIEERPLGPNGLDGGPTERRRYQGQE